MIRIRVRPEPGQTWRSRDKRDRSLEIRVLGVDDRYVQIKRFKKTRVRLDRFHEDYEGPVE